MYMVSGSATAPCIVRGKVIDKSPILIVIHVGFLVSYNKCGVSFYVYLALYMICLTSRCATPLGLDLS
jgi:hypothetical protein